MAKVSRLVLKTLVKECLFEILLEATGAEDSLIESRSSKLVERSRKTAKKQRVSRPALDNLKYDNSPVKRPINVQGITNDPVMTAIFEDTAMTTLQEQSAAEHGGPAGRGDAASLVAADNDPTDLFGGASQNWAALAFSDSPKK